MYVFLTIKQQPDENCFKQICSTSDKCNFIGCNISDVFRSIRFNQWTSIEIIEILYWRLYLCKCMCVSVYAIVFVCRISFFNAHGKTYELFREIGAKHVHIYAVTTVVRVIGEEFRLISSIGIWHTVQTSNVFRTQSNITVVYETNKVNKRPQMWEKESVHTIKYSNNNNADRHESISNLTEIGIKTVLLRLNLFHSLKSSFT